MTCVPAKGPAARIVAPRSEVSAGLLACRKQCESEFSKMCTADECFGCRGYDIGYDNITDTTDGCFNHECVTVFLKGLDQMKHIVFGNAGERRRWLNTLYTKP